MNTTVTSANLYPFHSEEYVVTWVGGIIGIVFSCLSLIRYFRFNYQRTQLTYVYHFSLGFSLLLAFISTPLHSITDYVWSFLPMSYEQQHRILCNFDLIAFFVASAGIGYSIAYASLERTFFIFYSQNIRLTWIRQFTPFLVIFSACSIIVTLFVLLSKCPLQISSCLDCYFGILTFQLIWFCLQFIIPFIFMLIAIVFLVYRIEIHTNRIRTSLNRKRSRKKFQRILIHINIYNIYYMLSICPINLYSIIRIFTNTKSRLTEIFLVNYLFLSLDCYPILIYYLTQVKQQHRIKFHQEPRQSPYIIITYPSVQLDEYQRTRL
jgi:hypothetical protein